MPRGGNVIATAKDAGKALITSASDRLVRSIDGSGLGGNITAVGKDAGKALITSGSDRAVRAIDGSGLCCDRCGAVGGRLPVRTVVHEYGAGARHDLPAGKKKTKRHMEGLRSMQGRDDVFVAGSEAARQHMADLRAMRGQSAEKPKRTGRFPKGSEEAREHMAKLRAMRKAK